MFRSPNPSVLLTVLVSILLTFFPITSSAAALTYVVTPGEKACFFAPIGHADLKVNFYFAVQSGGSFEINYEVTDPSGRLVIDGEKERQGDMVFTALMAGDYRFCLNNPSGIFSSEHAKMVDFEIAVQDESKTAKLPTKQGSTDGKTSVIEDSLVKLSNQLSTVARNQKYFRTRENRNFSTVRSTEGKIFSFTILQAFLMVGMAALQVFIVKFFFRGARKGYV